MSDISNWSTSAETGYQFTTPPPHGFPEQELPSVTNNVTREVMAAMARRYEDARGSLLSTGLASAYVVAATETVSALYDGLRVGWQANHTNTGNTTLDWDGTGPKSVLKDFNVELRPGDIQDGQKNDTVFDATNDVWQILSVRSNTGKVTVDTFSGDAVQTVFVLSEDPGTKNNVSVYIDGVFQHPSTFSLSGTSLTFTEAPPSSTEVIVPLVSPAAASAVADNEVTLAKMASGAAGGIIGYDASGNPEDIGAGNAGDALISDGASSPYWGSYLPTGVYFPYVGTAAPSGYVLASGRTIGDALSGATERANADTEALFTLLWNSWSDNEAPVTGGRGASAAADWAAGKVIAVVDMRGTAIVGLDDMGGALAGRITSASVGGANAGLPGGRLGAETHKLTLPESPIHTHPGKSGTRTDRGYAGSPTTGAPTDLDDTGLAGGDQPHSNTQPSLISTVIVKL